VDVEDFVSWLGLFWYGDSKTIDSYDTDPGRCLELLDFVQVGESFVFGMRADVSLVKQ
jgi:hypothetical protein